MLTATPQPANDPPRVALTVDGLGNSPTVTILRQDPDGRQRAVRGGDPGTVTSGTWIGYDYEAPFGVPVVYSAVPARAATNLLTVNQNGLETDTTGWAAADANVTIARSTAAAAVGTASLSLTAVNAATLQATTPTGTAGMPVIPGETYTATARLRPGSTIRSVYIAITWYDITGAGVVGTINGTPVNETAGAWTQVIATGAAPAGAVFARVVVSAASAAVAEVHYVDDINLFATYGVTQTTAPTNMLTDSDYETGMPVWVTGYFGVTPAIVAGGVNGTANAVQITQTSTTNPQGVVHQAPIGVSTVLANTQVRIGAWVKATAGNTIYVNGNAYNPATTASLGEVTGSQFVADGTWQYVTADFTWAADFRPGAVIRQRTGGGYTVGHTITVDQTAIWTVASLAPVQLTVPDVWLIHPGVPDLSQPVAADHVEQFDTRSRSARSAVHQPLGRTTPIVVSEARSAVTSGLSIVTDTLVARDAVWDLLEDGSALLLNVPPSLGWGIPYEWISIGDVTETAIVGGDQIRRLVLPYSVVDRPVGGVLAQWTWADVLAAYPTYADLMAAHDTFGELLADIID